MNKLYFYLLAVFAIVSCGKSKIEGIPFQSKEDGKWGMVAPDGSMIFEEEFKETPTLAQNGCFLVKNKDNEWDVYSLGESPEKMSGGYLQMAEFTESVTPAVKKGEAVKLIGKDGNVKATLDKLDGKVVTGVSLFNESLAIFSVGDDKVSYGAIDTDGKVVVEPKYCSLSPCVDGKFLAVEEKYRDEENKDNVKVTVLDRSGKELFQFKLSKYDKSLSYFENGHLAVAEKDGDEYKWGFLDEKGEVALKPSSKIKNIADGDVKGDNFIYYDGESYGVMNIKGETLIRPKYDALVWATDDLLWAKNDDEYQLINIEGEKVSKEKYKEVKRSLDEKHMFVKIGKNEWGVIDSKGEESKDKNIPDIYNVSCSSGDSWIESNYVDIDELVKDINISADKLGAFGLDNSPQDIAKAYIAESGDSSSTLDPSDFFRDRLSYDKTFMGMNVNYEIYYNYGYMSEGDYYYGYNWSTNTPTYVCATISGGKLQGNQKSITSKIAAKIKSLGKVVKESERGAVVQLSGDKYIYVIGSNDNVVIQLGHGDCSYIQLPTGGFDENSADSPMQDSSAYDDSTAVDVACDSVSVSDDYYGK